MELLFKDEVYALIGAAMEVYNELGNGFLEAVYQEAYEVELSERNIVFESQKLLPIYYKNRKLKKEYKSDIIAFEKIIIELKVQEHLIKTDESQLLNYLNATNFQVGVLINFGSKNDLEWKRMILTK
ncbi:MAG: GxxExxY protein [Ignavibacteriales bacterium]|nr:GxxExxY protein [Ignavibacteriales bacterium]